MKNKEMYITQPNMFIPSKFIIHNKAQSNRIYNIYADILRKNHKTLTTFVDASSQPQKNGRVNIRKIIKDKFLSICKKTLDRKSLFKIMLMLNKELSKKNVKSIYGKSRNRLRKKKNKRKKIIERIRKIKTAYLQKKTTGNNKEQKKRIHQTYFNNCLKFNNGNKKRFKKLYLILKLIRIFNNICVNRSIRPIYIKNMDKKPSNLFGDVFRIQVPETPKVNSDKLEIFNRNHDENLIEKLKLLYLSKTYGNAASTFLKSKSNFKNSSVDTSLFQCTKRLGGRKNAFYPQLDMYSNLFNSSASPGFEGKNKFAEDSIICDTLSYNESLLNGCLSPIGSEADSVAVKSPVKKSIENESFSSINSNEDVKVNKTLPLRISVTSEPDTGNITNTIYREESRPKRRLTTSKQPNLIFSHNDVVTKKSIVKKYIDLPIRKFSLNRIPAEIINNRFTFNKDRVASYGNSGNKEIISRSPSVCLEGEKATVKITPIENSSKPQYIHLNKLKQHYQKIQSDKLSSRMYYQNFSSETNHNSIYTISRHVSLDSTFPTARKVKIDVKIPNEKNNNLIRIFYQPKSSSMEKVSQQINDVRLAILQESKFHNDEMEMIKKINSRFPKIKLGETIVKSLLNRTSAVFKIPSNINLIRTITPKNYLSKYVDVKAHNRLNIYKNKTAIALKYIYPNLINDNTFKEIAGISGLEQTPVNYEYFKGICAFSERYLYNKINENNPMDDRKKRVSYEILDRNIALNRMQYEVPISAILKHL
ncbi:hypothetical protein A3Q56_01676 [Intoshia linei]|uniref:Uncharacterized protein n=1 Tax=Intoshia linei TaxID=1819745 RepID=A0A177B8V7_9BILA|nr:hypothetical protein A3Q56_01676 [Intoshia linei]